MPAFDNLLIVVAVAFAAPLLLGFFPKVLLPSVVLEILAGIVIGPSVLGIVEVDESIEVIAVIGLAFLLFLAGLEIAFDRLRGQVLRLTLVGFAVSFAIAVLVSLLLKGTGLIETPLLVAIILCATSLGVLIPVLKDAGEISSTFGQLVVAAGTIADFGAVILLSIFFSGEKRQQVEEHIPMRRAGDADEMAGVTCFLASDDAAYITGQTIFVDGGLTLFPSFATPWSSE
jgi:Kef-type K+ transport system membrane component KefB